MPAAFVDASPRAAVHRHADQLAYVSQPAKAQVDFDISRQTLIEGYSA